MINQELTVRCWKHGYSSYLSTVCPMCAVEDLRNVVKYLADFVRGDYQGTQAWKNEILPRIQSVIKEYK